ncbi:MAG: DNA repair protein RecN [Lachnospiraceae bacterium]|nr:DNA repair protein RecN [Lachnospiraceae bacterium]
MLSNLHVKNLALIKEADVYFQNGLNILTGETGAGKSLIIGSLNLALGGKIQTDMVRKDAEYALVELVFEISSDEQIKMLREMDIEVEGDGQLILSRRIQAGRSYAKINGETVTATTLKAVAELLIDIHGQHEHQSLLYKKNHLSILDNYVGESLLQLRKQVKESYDNYIKLQKQLSESVMDESEKKREIELLQYEIKEIEKIDFKPFEDEELETLYRKMCNSKKIMEVMNAVYAETSYTSGNGAGDAVGRALRDMKSLLGLDEELDELSNQLSEVDDLLNDFNRSLAEYMEGMSFKSEEFIATEERLNEINHLKSKYGNTYEKIQEYFLIQSEKLLKYSDYDEFIQSLQKEIEEVKSNMIKQSEKLSSLRKKNAVILSKQMKDALVDLNFLDVQFEIVVHSNLEKFSAKGFDDVEFMISTNPGEKIKPLAEIASGGELSRIMLALKTVIATKDEISTMIFDEIDTGISGRTAQKVAQKLSELSKKTQIICITHLPQIAAFANHHFLIQKETKNGATLTDIHELDETEIVEELSRIIGGTEITDIVRESAREMKELAKTSSLK